MLIHIVYDIIIVIALVIGLVRFKKLTSPFRILTYSIAVTILLEVLSSVFIRRFGNNVLIYHFMSMTGYIFYSLTYFYLFKSNIIKKGILILGPLTMIFFFINLLYLQQPANKQFPTNIYLITNALQVVFSLLMFKQMLQYLVSINIIKQSTFWFNTAILFFSTTMFLNMGLLNYYAEHNWGYDMIYYLWEGNFCLFNTLICVSLLMDSKTHNTEHG